MRSGKSRIVALTLAGTLMGLAGTGCSSLSAQARKDLVAAHEFYASGDYATCVDRIDEFFAKHGETPASGEAYQLQGISEMHLGAGHGERARVALVKAIEADSPPKVKRGALVGLGNLCFEDGRYEDAIPYYEQALEEFPNASPKEKALYRLGYSLQMVGKWSLANRRFSRLKRLFGDTPESKEAEKLFGHNCFYIQAGAFEKRESAHTLRSWLIQRNLPAQVMSVFGAGNKTYHVVAIGRYQNYHQAKAAFDQYEPALRETSGTVLIRSGFGT